MRRAKSIGEACTPVCSLATTFLTGLFGHPGRPVNCNRVGHTQGETHRQPDAHVWSAGPALSFLLTLMLARASMCGQCVYVCVTCSARLRIRLAHAPRATHTVDTSSESCFSLAFWCFPRPIRHISLTCMQPVATSLALFNHSTHMTLLALFAPVTASHAAVASASATTNCLTDLDFSTASTAVRRKTAGPHKHVLPYGAQGRRGYTTVVARHLERLTEACHDRTRGESKCATTRRQHQASTSQHRVV
jgi:hypothetical protein